MYEPNDSGVLRIERALEHDSIGSNSMNDETIAPALAAYFDGYNTADRELLSRAFAADATLSVNHLDPAIGRDAVVGMHVRMGVYHYRVRRVIRASDDLQVVEGAIYAVREGQDIED